MVTPRFWTTIGPVSTPSSGTKIDTPDSASPSMICHCMALPPRKRGSSEGWKQMLRRGGASVIARGRNEVIEAITFSSASHAR